jgi:signal peptidase II
VRQSPKRHIKNALVAGGTVRLSAQVKSTPICVIGVKTSLQKRSLKIGMRFILFLSLPLYALDQWTKQMVLRYVSPDEPRVLVSDFFSLVNVTNTGAAFGSFRGNNTFFIVISSVALVIVLGLLLRAQIPDRWRDISLALLLAGIVGNLTDRLLYGHVIDFLLVDLHVPYAHPWPAFNVADSCISVAVVLFIIHSFWKQKTTVVEG